MLCELTPVFRISIEFTKSHSQKAQVEFERLLDWLATERIEPFKRSGVVYDGYRDGRFERDFNEVDARKVAAWCEARGYTVLEYPRSK